MIIAVASGKGGTGKTTIAAALARVWPTRRLAVDLDVEAPNLHLFIKAQWGAEETATIEVPVADPDLCNDCGACRDICAFGAITVIDGFPMPFADMCHGCGGCLAVCPTGALRPGARELGTVNWGEAPGGLPVMSGQMRVGEAHSPPLIRHLRRQMKRLQAELHGDIIIDSPPGASCPAVESVRDADAVVLVTEPTPFGHYDLDLAHRAFAALDKPMAVVINRAGGDTRPTETFCAARDLPVLDAIPFDRSIAQAYARGVPLDAVSPQYGERCRRLADRVRAVAEGRTMEGLVDA